MTLLVIQLAQNWDNAASLANLTPQPHVEGIQYPGEVVAPVFVHDDGLPFVWLRYKVLSASQYTALLTAAGLSMSIKSAKVTIKLPADARTSGANYNGVIVRPDHGSDARWETPLYRNVAFLVRRLIAL